MILERTMIFGFTLRNDIPTSSRIPTLASVIFAWIQRLKYLAKKMNATSKNKAIAMMTRTTYVDQRVAGSFTWANNKDVIPNPLARGADRTAATVRPGVGRGP